MKNFVFTTDDFFAQAEGLRAAFDQRFADPLAGHSDRFVWDYWHVPDQYTLMRTPAEHYFPPDLFDTFINHLTDWGRKNLGCGAISPPWLSYYVDGCQQNMHADNPHGPWAFVYSLTDWQSRRFDGGETFILRPEVLDYWNGFSSQQGFEKEHLLEKVEPLFNRLTVFDPRFPHGVEPVRGSRDPRHSRLVIHGWFTEPGPFFEGGIDENEAGETLNQTLDPLIDQFTEMGYYDGILTLRIPIDAAGEVGRIDLLKSNLRATDVSSAPVEQLIELSIEALEKARFPASPSGGVITLPLVFQ